MDGQNESCFDSVIIGRLVFTAGNGLSVPTFIPHSLHANDTSQFLIEGLSELVFLDVTKRLRTDSSTATVVIAFVAYFLMHDVRILVTIVILANSPPVSGNCKVSHRGRAEICRRGLEGRFPWPGDALQQEIHLASCRRLEDLPAGY
jgi:hypothetical protein